MTRSTSTVRSRRTLASLLSLAVAGVLMVGGAAVAGAAGSPTARLHRASIAAAPAHARRYVVNRPVCAPSKDPNVVRCQAMRRVAVAKGTLGAIAIPAQGFGSGPEGGYTPAELATLYGYNPKTSRATQVVAVVDAFNDPDALSDLQAFDTKYALPKETATSFRKVNQSGQTTGLPKSDSGWAGEIALDVETVRAVCNTCRILLVETSDQTMPDFAAGENTAARLGATEISNSFGIPETSKATASVLAGFNHPGVVITASSGDAGWYEWDEDNLRAASADAPLFPATDPDVIAVGGTEIVPTSTGTRSDEGVWNEAVFNDEGASGGGCSHLYAAPAWQVNYKGYKATGCGTKRLTSDISADADPESGFDVLDSYGTTSPWETIGGTSLSSPMVAGMFALAGGSGGARYPASSLYVNGTHRASSLFDVTEGGNGFCGYNTNTACSNYTEQNYGNTNPNGIGLGNIDCSFPRNASPVTTVPTALDPECNATTGFDGPTGLGAPKGTGVFTNTSPSASITRPTSATVHKSVTFTAGVKEPITGAKITRYAWSWGDKASTNTASATTHHTYAKTGKFTVTLTVTDNRYQVVVKTTTITIKK